MVKIIQKHKECIGCGACAAMCPDFWEMKEEDGLAHLKGATEKEGAIQELEIDKKDLGCNEEARDVCPVDVIEIKD